MTIYARGNEATAAVVPFFPRTGSIRRDVVMHDEVPSDPTPLLAKAMDTLDCGLVVTDLSSKVLHANQAAQGALMSGFLKVCNGILCAATATATRKLQTAIAACLQDDSPPSVWFDVAGVRRVVTVSAAHLGAHGAASGGHQAIVVVTFRTAPRDGFLSDQMGRAFFDLTPAEARVAREVVRGDGMKACAQRLGVTPNTARTHLKRVFDKTGTKRQAELVRLLLNCRG